MDLRTHYTLFSFFVVLFQLVLIVREKKSRILLLTRRCTVNRENVDNILFSKLRKLKALKEIYFLCIPNNRTIKILCCYIFNKRKAISCDVHISSCWLWASWIITHPHYLPKSIKHRNACKIIPWERFLDMKMLSFQYLGGVLGCRWFSLGREANLTLNSARRFSQPFNTRPTYFTLSACNLIWCYYFSFPLATCSLAKVESTRFTLNKCDFTPNLLKFYTIKSI